jgi:circadian clock protein KaiC
VHFEFSDEPQLLRLSAALFRLRILEVRPQIALRDVGETDLMASRKTTAKSSTTPRKRSERIPSGVPGLDVVLDGGFLRGGVYLVRGAPGSGKTILANQICFATARRGGGQAGQAAYLTLLAESHARMILHIEQLTFFDPDLVEERVQYLSGFHALETGGVRGVLDFIRRELLRSSRKAKSGTGGNILVIDGFVALNESMESVTELKKFVHELQLHADMTGCTVLLLVGPNHDSTRPENTMVDGILDLSEEIVDLRAFRQIQVRKFRGGGHLGGGHLFEINNDGITVHPRIEAVYQAPSAIDQSADDKVPTGIPNLDQMLRGGVQGGTTTMVFGPSGSGKTTLGLHYIAATPAKHRGLFFSFYETPPRLLAKARRLNLDLDKRIEAGDIEIIWQPSTEQNVDALVEKLLRAIRRVGAKRLFIDGLDGFQRATIHAHRAHHIFTALANELRVRNVTTLYTYEVPKFIGPDLEAPITGVSTLAENIIYLRFVELRSQLYRLLSIMKVREGSYDSSLREFALSENGIRLEDTFDSAESILTGSARLVPQRKAQTAARPRQKPGAKKK